jgi:Fe-S cluster biogenesis protein NfuA
MTARDKIEEVLASIRPALHSDGGDVEFLDYDEDDGVVHLRLMGACGSCPVSMLTLKQGIERRIMMAVPEVTGASTRSEAAGPRRLLDS